MFAALNSKLRKTRVESTVAGPVVIWRVLFICDSFGSWHGRRDTLYHAELTSSSLTLWYWRISN